MDGMCPCAPPRRIRPRQARRGRVRGRLRREARSPRACRCEHTAVLHGVEPRRGHAGRQPTEERQRVHVDRHRPVGVGLLQCDADQTVGSLLETLLGEGRPEHVAQQRLAAHRIESTRTWGRMQGEPVQRGAERLVVRQRAAADRSGTAVITLRVGDGDATAERAFSLVVLAANDPPIVSGPGAAMIGEDEPTGALPFQVADVETVAEALTVTASSSNPALVPPDGIALGGHGSDRTVRLTPAANAHGTAVVTLAVSDGTDTTTVTFELTVTSVNDGPTISDVADRRIGENRSTEPIPFEVGDVDNDPGSLTLTASSSNPALVGASGIVFGGSGRSRTVTLRPQRNQRGTAPSP